MKSAIRIFVVLFFLIVFFSSCNSDISKESVIVIHGKILNYNGHEIILEELSPMNIFEIARIKTEADGSFVITLDSIKPTFYRLKIDDNNLIHLFLRNGDSIYIMAEYPVIPRTYEVEGSDDCTLLKNLNYELIKSTDILNQLKKTYSELIVNPNVNIDSLKQSLTKISDELYLADRELLTRFIHENYKSPVIYVALYQYILENPILQMENDYELFEFAMNSLKEYNPNLEQNVLLESELTKVMMKKQQENRNMNMPKIGDIAPDFSLIDHEGRVLNLSNLRDSTVIIYFWASWSETSLKHFTVLKDLYAKYNVRGLSIILVSLDSDRVLWENTIKNNRLQTLHQASDFKIWESPVVRVYGLNSIPFWFIIDKKGIINANGSDTESLKREIKREMTKQ